MIVYDIEVFAKDYLFGAYNGKVYYQFWNNDQPKILEFYNKHKNEIWVGHNSLHYDSPLVKMMLYNQTPEQIKWASDTIVSGGDIGTRI